MTPWGELALLAGATGEPIWSRKLVNMDVQVDHFIVGPDIDGDGTCEVFAATLGGTGTELYVDALSGVTGKSLWTAHRNLQTKNGGFSEFQIGGLDWWQAGREGWPQLTVRLLDAHPTSEQSKVFLLSAGTGQLSHVAGDVHSLTPVDLDGDRVEDLVVFSGNPSEPDVGGKLHAVRGVGKAPWQRLGALGAPTADLDGDGVVDLVQSWGDGTLLATSGATGERLWKSRPIKTAYELIVRAAGATGSNRVATEANDFDGDGIVDLVVCCRSTSGNEIPGLHAVSGKSGRRLWTAEDVTMTTIGGTISLTSCDLQGDGSPEVIWLVACDHGYPERFGYSSSETQLWMFVVSARSGELQWSTPLSPAYGMTPTAWPPFGFQEVDLAVVAADLNRDGTRDLLVPAATNDDLLELRALDGTNGQQLWSRPRIDDGLGHQSLQNWTSPTVVDFEGDGTAEVVVVEPAAPTDKESQQLQIAVTTLNGADGKLLSTRPTGFRFSQFQGFSHAHKGELLRPVRLRRPGERQCAAILLPAMSGEARLMVVDGEGEPTGRGLPLQSQFIPPAACDIDGNGSDELVCWQLTAIEVIDPGQLDKAIWSRNFGESGYFQLLDIRPRGEGRSPLLAVAMPGSDNRVFGIDAATGDTVWTCPGPIPRDGPGVYMMPNTVALLGSPEGQAPLVYYATGFANDCRHAVLAAAEGATGDSLAKRGITPVPAVTTGLERDPRLLRSLPWEPQEEGTMGRVITFCAWAALFAVTLVLLPGWFLWWMVARRRFSLQTLLLLPVVAAIFLVFAMLQPSSDYEFSTFATRMSVAIGATPPVVAILLLGYWTLARRWRRVALVLTIWVVVSLMVGVAGVVAQLQQSPMLPEERFDWSSWYEVFFPGGFLASWPLVVLLVLARAVKWTWRKLRPRRKSEGVAVADDPATAAYSTSSIPIGPPPVGQASTLL